MAINIGENNDKEVTYANSPDINRVLFKNLSEGASADDIADAVNAWIEEHPEAVTTVLDGSILPVKLDSSNNPSDGYVLSWNATAGKFEWIDIQSDITELKNDFTQFSIVKKSYSSGYWSNVGYNGASNAKRLSIFMNNESGKFYSVSAPSGYKVALSAKSGSTIYVWTGTQWSTANLGYFTSIDLHNISFDGYSKIGFTLSADDSSDISKSVGANVVFEEGCIASFPYMMEMSDAQIFNDFSNAILPDLNNADVNTTYIVQRTGNTTTANFPSDFPTTGVLALLRTFKAHFHETNYQIVQVLTRLSTNETWYRTYSSTTSTWGNWSKSSTDGGIITVGAGQTYTTLKAGIEAAVSKNNVTVYVLPGVYDLVQEFSSEISSAMNTVGIALGNDVRIVFADGAKVTANFDNSNSTYDATTWRRIYDYFNPFYSKFFNGNANFTLENLNIESKNTRYCVHDEASGSGTYTHKYINCKMKYTNEHSDISYVQCIGGGLGEHGTIVIDGGYYESITDYGFQSVGGSAENSQQCVSYHNGNIATADSSIAIKDVYLADRGYFRFGYYGVSAIESIIQISGCGTGLPTLKLREGSGTNPDNFSVVEWNDDTRINAHWSVSSDGQTATLVAD